MAHPTALPRVLTHFYDLKISSLRRIKANKMQAVILNVTEVSSFSWAPNVLQPYWLIVLPLDVLDLTASLLL